MEWDGTFRAPAPPPLPHAEVERRVLQWYSRRKGYTHVEQPRGRCLAYDAKCFRGDTLACTLEIKCDWASADTPNFMFETRNCWRDEPSGLTATQADKYLHVAPGRNLVLIYSPASMLSWLTTKRRPGKPTPRFVTKAGDGNGEGWLALQEVVLALPWVQQVPFSLWEEE